MAIAKKTSEEKTNYVVNVKRAKQWESGNISVDLEVNGVTVYGCSYVQGKKNDKEYAFISFPSQKGKDGNYYNHAFFPISAELLADIEKQIEAML